MRGWSSERGRASGGRPLGRLVELEERDRENDDGYDHGNGGERHHYSESFVGAGKAKGHDRRHDHRGRKADRFEERISHGFFLVQRNFSVTVFPQENGGWDHD